MPGVRKQQSITVDASYGAKSRQPLPFGSDEQTDLYNLLRQSQEGLHGLAKDDAYEALAACGQPPRAGAPWSTAHRGSGPGPGRPAHRSAVASARRDGGGRRRRADGPG